MDRSQKEIAKMQVEIAKLKIDTLSSQAVSLENGAKFVVEEV